MWPAEEGSAIPDALLPAVRRIDPEIPAAFAGYEFLGEYLLLTGDQDEAADMPVLPEPPQVSLGPHLGYAAQWFLFALVVLLGYPALLRRNLRH
jgi:cytochrome oxidase assembly protein ShyY1